MTDYVLEQWNLAGIEELQKYYSIAKYAYFLKQPLTLGMFIPCDENGNVLEEPKNLVWQKDDVCISVNGKIENNNEYINKLHQAKSKVIFEGVEVRFNNCKEFKFQSETINFIIDKETSIEYNCYYKNYIVCFDNNRDFKTIETIEDLIPYNLTLNDNFKL